MLVDINTQYYKDVNYAKSNAIPKKKKSQQNFHGLDKLIQKFQKWKIKIPPLTKTLIKKRAT